ATSATGAGGLTDHCTPGAVIGRTRGSDGAGDASGVSVFIQFAVEVGVRHPVGDDGAFGDGVVGAGALGDRLVAEHLNLELVQLAGDLAQFAALTPRVDASRDEADGQPQQQSDGHDVDDGDGRQEVGEQRQPHQVGIGAVEEPQVHRDQHQQYDLDDA